MLIFLSSVEFLTPEEKVFLETIYINEGKKMWCIAISILKNKEQAEDAVQTAFLKLAKHVSTLQSIQDKNKQGYYIHTTVKNTALTMCKKRQKEKIICNDTLDYFHLKSADDYTDTFEDTFIFMEDFHEIEVFLNKLKPIYKQAVYLRFILELSYPEIADICNITQVNARFRVSYALKQIRKFAKKAGNENV